MERPVVNGRVGHRMTHKLGWPTCATGLWRGGVGRQPEAGRAKGSPVHNRSGAADEIWPTPAGLAQAKGEPSGGDRG
jgi:hypothetical protein